MSLQDHRAELMDVASVVDFSKLMDECGPTSAVMDLAQVLNVPVARLCAQRHALESSGLYEKSYLSLALEYGRDIDRSWFERNKVMLDKFGAVVAGVYGAGVTSLAFVKGLPPLFRTVAGLVGSIILLGSIVNMRNKYVELPRRIREVARIPLPSTPTDFESYKVNVLHTLEQNAMADVLTESSDRARMVQSEITPQQIEQAYVGLKIVAESSHELRIAIGELEAVGDTAAAQTEVGAKAFSWLSLTITSLMNTIHPVLLAAEQVSGPSVLNQLVHRPPDVVYVHHHY